eukprot:gnl/TRDRNA2_/TRDRNA2_81168_c0_seq1.p1 gnl/TRDRNA2_/TRDRNA2_81168_c0~~gnl/TRDRNA2_/TRDRNA2_81168_c0_seq1.p1  ORF type:complete len:638 (+),score=101.15 gnl/TRDRNA2_/TRDRNA2_81168_c0_seq1:139-2052(+)
MVSRAARHPPHPRKVEVVRVFGVIEVIAFAYFTICPFATAAKSGHTEHYDGDATSDDVEETVLYQRVEHRMKRMSQLSTNVQLPRASSCDMHMGECFSEVDSLDITPSSGSSLLQGRSRLGKSALGMTEEEEETAESSTMTKRSSHPANIAASSGQNAQDVPHVSESGLMSTKAQQGPEESTMALPPVLLQEESRQNVAKRSTPAEHQQAPAPESHMKGSKEDFRSSHAIPVAEPHAIPQNVSILQDWRILQETQLRMQGMKLRALAFCQSAVDIIATRLRSKMRPATATAAASVFVVVVVLIVIAALAAAAIYWLDVGEHMKEHLQERGGAARSARSSHDRITRDESSWAVDPLKPRTEPAVIAVPSSSRARRSNNDGLVSPPFSATMLEPRGDARAGISPGPAPSLAAASVPPSASSAPSNIGPTPLCPELVVPEDHECALVIPREAAGRWNAGEFGGFCITDTSGAPVLRFSVTTPPPSPQDSTEGGHEMRAPKLVLSSASGGQVLAYCCARPGAFGPFFVYRHTGELFATLDRDTSLVPDPSRPAEASLRYTLTDRAGQQLRFETPEQKGQMRVSGDNGVLQATVGLAEKQGVASSVDGILLRVGPRADVGALLCGLISTLQLRRMGGSQWAP